VDKTIIYYTANRESIGLNRLVRDNLLIAGLPIISVSQKPVSFGHNICVGDVGYSSHNSVMQVLIGATCAKTRYVVLAEADCLYPVEHFRYKPRSDKIFWYDRNVWALCTQGFVKHKQTSVASIIVGRDKIIKSIQKSLRNRKLWYRKDTKNNLPKAYRRHGWHSYWTEVPIVKIDHENSLHGPHNLHGKEVEYFDELKPWGKAKDIQKEIV